MKSIHVAHKSENANHQPQRVDGTIGVYESGNWVVNIKRAASLIGSKIYLHKLRSEPSFLGGEIISFREILPKNKFVRVVFRFREDPECTGVLTSSKGWRNEYKITE
jgi:hypothetical protein